MILAVLANTVCLLGQPSDIDKFLTAGDGIKTAKMTLVQNVPDIAAERNRARDVVVAGNCQYVLDTIPRTDGSRRGVFITPDATFVIAKFPTPPMAVSITPKTGPKPGLVPVIREIAFAPLSLARLRQEKSQLSAKKVGDEIEITYESPEHSQVIYTVSPTRGHNVLETRIRKNPSSPAKVFAKADVCRLDGVWHWSNIKWFGGDGLLTNEFSISVAEFNKPTHETTLTLASVGLEPGGYVEDLRPTRNEPPYMGEPSLAWDGHELLPQSEYHRRIRTGLIANPNRQPGDLTQEDHRRLTVSHADSYDRAALYFARENFFTEAQLLAAQGIADDTRAHHPAATQPAQQREVIVTSMMPRLVSLLTKEQAASRPSTRKLPVSP